MSIPLPYALPDTPDVRRPTGVLDWTYLALVIACYALSFYAGSIMPGAPNWSAEFEVANFWYTVAAFSSGLLFLAGVGELVVFGYRRANQIILLGMLLAVALAPLLLCLTRWLQCNFA